MYAYNKTIMQKCCKNIQFQSFFLNTCNKILLDSEIFFSILKYFFLDSETFFLDCEIFFLFKFFFSRLRNFFVDFIIFFFESEIFFWIPNFFFSILKVYSRLWKFFLNFESFFLMAAIDHHSLWFNITLKLETINRRTHPNKIKKPCWQQVPISKSLLWGNSMWLRAKSEAIKMKVKNESWLKYFCERDLGKMKSASKNYYNQFIKNFQSNSLWRKFMQEKKVKKSSNIVYSYSSYLALSSAILLWNRNC